MSFHNLLRRHLVREEGLRLEPYKDSEGYWTIGIGHLIDSRKGGKLPPGVVSFPISREQAFQILEMDVHGVECDLWSRFPTFKRLSDPRKVVLASMAFQMGISGLFGFQKMLDFVQIGHFEAASAEMLDSRWAKQTPGRARRLYNAMYNDSEEELT